MSVIALADGSNEEEYHLDDRRSPSGVRQ